MLSFKIEMIRIIPSLFHIPSKRLLTLAQNTNTAMPQQMLNMNGAMRRPHIVGVTDSQLRKTLATRVDTIHMDLSTQQSQCCLVNKLHWLMHHGSICASTVEARVRGRTSTRIWEKWPENPSKLHKRWTPVSSENVSFILIYEINAIVLITNSSFTSVRWTFAGSRTKNPVTPSTGWYLLVRYIKREKGRGFTNAIKCEDQIMNSR